MSHVQDVKKGDHFLAFCTKTLSDIFLCLFAAVISFPLPEVRNNFMIFNNFQDKVWVDCISNGIKQVKITNFLITLFHFYPLFLDYQRQNGAVTWSFDTRSVEIQCFKYQFKSFPFHCTTIAMPPLYIDVYIFNLLPFHKEW